MAYTPPWAIKEKKEDEERVGVSESERESKVDWKKKERVRKEEKRGDLYFFSFGLEETGVCSRFIFVL